MKHFKYTLTLGLTIFAVMFGAGNIILPPAVGYFAGGHFFVAILAFIFTSAGFAAIGICSMALQKNNFLDITKKIHPKAHLFLLTAVVIIIGPLFAGPRTAIITNELFVNELVNSSNILVYAVSSFIFFFLTAYVLLSGTNIVDIIGKYLTPALLLLMIVLIGGTIVADNPLKQTGVDLSTAFIKGSEIGYFTVDGLGYVIIATISIRAILTEKSMKHFDKTMVLMRSVLIALFLIALVYLGLGYMGAASTLEAINGVSPDGITILNHSISSIFGKFGNIIFGLAVALACLTTSIGLMANTSSFFASNSRINQKTWVYVFTIISYVVSLLPLDRLTTYIGPILMLLVPPAMCIAFLGYINRKVRKRRTIIVPFVVSVVMGVLAMLCDFIPELKDALKVLPFAKYGFPWLGVVLAAIFIMMAVELMSENDSIYEEYNDEYKSLKATD
ncbi:branched-chain amino acid transport system II carrier protein [Mycoplasmatota bacterium WC44]